MRSVNSMDSRDGFDKATEKQKVKPAANPVRCWPAVSDANTSRSGVGGYVDIMTHRGENDKEIRVMDVRVAVVGSRSFPQLDSVTWFNFNASQRAILEAV